MGKFALQMLLFILVATNISLAQNTLLAGKIVDANDKPVAGAVMKVITGKKIIETTADEDGLYYTKLFPAGKYDVRIYNSGQCYKAHEITVAARDKVKRFYDFQLTGNKAVEHIDEQDPFMAVAFNKIEAKQHLYDFPVIRRYTRVQYEDLIIDGNVIDGNGVRSIQYINDSNEFGKALDSSSSRRIRNN